MADIVRYERPAAPVMNPATGELVDLADPTDVLARQRADIREVESQLQEFKRLLDREIIDRMDADATWTLRVDGLKVEAPSPAPAEVFDAESLWNGLHSIARDVGLTEDAIHKAVTEERSYKVSKRGITALRKLGGEVARVIDRCSSYEQRDRRVRVSVDR